MVLEAFLWHMLHHTFEFISPIANASFATLSAWDLACFGSWQTLFAWSFFCIITSVFVFIISIWACFQSFFPSFCEVCLPFLLSFWYVYPLHSSVFSSLHSPLQLHILSTTPLQYSFGGGYHGACLGQSSQTSSISVWPQVTNVW